MKPVFIISMTAIMIFWGINGILFKSVLNQISVDMYLLMHVAFFSIIFLPFIRIPRRMWRFGAKMGLIYFSSALLGNLGLSKLDPSSFMVLVQSQVIFMILWGLIFFKERLTLREIIGVVLCIGGVVAIFGIPHLSFLGAFFVLLQGAINPLIVINMKERPELSGSQFTAAMIYFSVPCFVLYFIFGGGLGFVNTGMPDVNWWFILPAIVYGSLINMALNVASKWVAKYNDVKKIAPFNVVQPVFVIVASSVIAMEAPSEGLVIGCVLVVAGLLLALVKPDGKAEGEPLTGESRA